MRSTARLFALALCTLAAGCVARGASPFAAVRRPAPATTIVHVVNRGYADVVVYLADGNTPFRLGAVPGLERASLRVPNQLAAGGIRLLVRARDSGRLYATEVLVPGAGGVLALTVQPMLLASEVTVLSYGALER